MGRKFWRWLVAVWRWWRGYRPILTSAPLSWWGVRSDLMGTRAWVNRTYTWSRYVHGAYRGEKSRTVTEPRRGVIGATGECRRQTDRLRAETVATEATMAQWRKEAPYGG